MKKNELTKKEAILNKLKWLEIELSNLNYMKFLLENINNNEFNQKRMYELINKNIEKTLKNIKYYEQINIVEGEK